MQDFGDAGAALVPRCAGAVEAGFAYDLLTRTLTVHVLQARDVPLRDAKGGVPNTQVLNYEKYKASK